MHHDIHLAGYGARLEPLRPEHAAALQALTDDALWAGMTCPWPRDAAEYEALIASQVADPSGYAFVVRGEDDVVRGSTSFYDLSVSQRRVEIGSTWYGRAWWGTDNNPAVKRLMFAYAFDTLGMYRVALRCDARNERSAAAIRHLGARAEGVLRSHRVAADGTRGDTAYFSVLLPEWSDVRAGLDRRLGRADH